MRNLRLLPLVGLVLITAFTAHAQTLTRRQLREQQAQDRAALHRLVGTYRVSFDFVETVSPDTAYRRHAPYHSGGLEEVLLIRDRPDTVELQHLLVVPDGSIVKHWREEWVWQPKRILAFTAPGQWAWRDVPPARARGQWSQTVYQVDDSPRYAGVGAWVHSATTGQAGHGSYWEATADSPLPRREFTKRSDYNVLGRRNRVVIEDNGGWLHAQDNRKLVRAVTINGGTDAGKPDRLICLEKGYERYTAVPTEQGKPARDWWATNGAFWATTRQVWATTNAAAPTLLLASGKVDGSLLWEKLFGLGEKTASADGASAATRAAIRAAIGQHLGKATAAAPGAATTN